MHPDYKEARELRDNGMKIKDIAAHFGLHCSTVGAILGRKDPGSPHPEFRPGETPEQRAFRRFPINFHKPGAL